MYLVHRITERLASQLDALESIVRDRDDRVLSSQSDGKWSALENLAHVARHQQIFVERIKEILHFDAPALPAYRADHDSEWPRWQALSSDEVVRRLHAGQRALIDVIRPLTESQLARVGVHSTFGRMTLAELLDFFLVHQAHHFYVAMKLARSPQQRT